MPESRFPLRLASFGHGSAYPNTIPRPVGRTVVADGRDYLAQAWIGPDASAAKRAALQQVVASLRSRGCGSARRSATASASSSRPATTRSARSGAFACWGQPFYLVQAPGGFYAVGWTWES